MTAEPNQTSHMGETISEKVSGKITGISNGIIEIEYRWLDRVYFEPYETDGMKVGDKIEVDQFQVEYDHEDGDLSKRYHAEEAK